MVTPEGTEPQHLSGGIFWDPAEHSGEGHPRRWAILGVLLVSLLIVVLDNTVLNIALPTIQRDLAATPGELVWAVDAYILAFAALLFTWGVLGDKYGRRRILLIGLTLFAVASAICAFSVNAHMLIGFRAVMGVGGAAVLPVTLAIITVVFPREERGKAIGTWAGAVGGAVALGPVLGGLLLQHPEWSEWLTGNAWGSVFLINVPIIAFGIVGIIRVVPETRNPSPRRLDVTGLVVSAVGLFLLVFGIIHASEAGTWIDPLVLGPIVAGVGILTVFVVMEARSDHASFDVSLFGSRGFSVSLAAMSLAFFALSGITFTLPFFLQVLRGYDTLQAGLCFIPFAVGQLLAAPRSAKVVGRFGYRPVMTVGLVVVGGACLGIAAMDVETPLWVILTVFFAFGFGMGNVMAPASTLIQNSLPLAQAGAGSAVSNTVRQVGGALGVAVIGTLLATTYAAAANETLAGLPDQARATASTSIVATDVVLDAAIDGGLPADQAEVLRAAAYQDFLDATQLTSLISAGIVAMAALVVILFLPTITPPEQVQQKAAADPGS